jgi:DNA-binding transcriptional LysR family regulator
MDVFTSVKAFVAVADEGGFAKAARKAGTAISSVTHKADALDEYLGAILKRSTRGVTLTPAGQTYYTEAVRILSDLDEANRSVSEAARRGVFCALACRLPSPDCTSHRSGPNF